MALFIDAGSLWSDAFWEEKIQKTSTNTNSSIWTTIQDDRKTGETRRISEFFKTNPGKYFKYSFGFGFRVQIPMMPLRFWFGQKMAWDYDKKKFKLLGDLTFQFAIMDRRI